ncbi:MAG: dockerin type I repeat-containing protein [Planctomycetales bacterium]|nr:dockerin type I repeat-containing protein [Planctomycetales bacterium]
MIDRTASSPFPSLRVALLTIIGTLCLANVSAATLSVSLPNATLLANTPGQWIDVAVAGGDSVSGLDLFLQVDGGGPQLVGYQLEGSRSGPRIQNVDFKTGTIFQSVTDTAVNVGSTSVELPQVSVWTLSLIGSTKTVAAEGTLVRVQIDTTGFFGGDWELKLKDVLPYDEFGGPYATSFAGVSATVTNGMLHIPIVRGDYNANQQFDAGDIDILAAAIRTTSTDLASYDLNGDQLVNTEDHRYWASNYAHVYLGDANLDGRFNSSDFVQAFVAGKYEDNVPANANWAEGDWNGDGDFTTTDLVAAFQEGGYEIGYHPAVPVNSVPEPGTATLALLGLLMLTEPRMSRMTRI